MKKGILALILGILSIQGSAVTARTLNGILLLEKGDAERAYLGDPYLLFYLREAILSQSAAVVVSGPILHSFLKSSKKKLYPKDLKYVMELAEGWRHSEKKIKELERIFSKEGPKIFKEKEKYEKLIKRYTRLKEKQFVYTDEWYELIYKKPHISRRFCTLDFNLQNWYIYQIANTDNFILIPPSYKQKLQKQWQYIKRRQQKRIQRLMSRMRLTERELMFGLKIDHEDLLKPIKTTKELAKLLKKWGKKRPKVSATFEGLSELKSIFVSGKNTLMGSWNFFWAGHGEESTLKKEKDIKAKIAGLDKKQFKKFLQFLARDIDVLFVYWVTCFGGGIHLDYATRVLRHLENTKLLQKAEEGIINTLPSGFIAASGALTDSSVWAAGTGLAPIVFCSKQASMIDLTKFFNVLSKFEVQMKNAMKIIQQKLAISPARRDIFLKNILLPEIIPALSAVTLFPEQFEDIYGLGSIPSIYLPGWRRFKAVALGDDIVVLDREFMMRHQYDFEYKDGKSVLIKNNEPLELTNKKVLLLYEKEIPMPLIITLDKRKKIVQSFPGFVSMIPGNAYHKLHELDFRSIDEIGDADFSFYNDISEIIEKIIFHMFGLYHKIFEINVLKGCWFTTKDEFYTEISDVIISKKGEIKKENDEEIDITRYTYMFSVTHKEGEKLFFKKSGLVKDYPISIKFDHKEITEQEYNKKRNRLLKQVGL